MKHTFDCGIIGESHDADGDSFLLGMVEGERRSVQELIDQTQAPILKELKRTQEALCFLIDAAGGEVRVPLLVTLKSTPVQEWRVYLDNKTQEVVLQTSKAEGKQT